MNSGVTFSHFGRVKNWLIFRLVNDPRFVWNRVKAGLWIDVNFYTIEHSEVNGTATAASVENRINRSIMCVFREHQSEIRFRRRPRKKTSACKTYVRFVAVSFRLACPGRTRTFRKRAYSNKSRTLTLRSRQIGLWNDIYTYKSV